MYAADHPKEFKFVRAGDQAPTPAEIMAAWDRVLEGQARIAALPKLPWAKLRKASSDLMQALHIVNRPQ